MSGDAHDFNNIETLAVIMFFFPARQGAEGNSRHSDKNIRGTFTIVCHRQKLGGGITLCESVTMLRHTYITHFLFGNIFNAAVLTEKLSK